MSKARDIANILSANTSIATDSEVTAAITTATSGLATASSVSTAVTNERTASATLTNKTIDGNSNTINVKRGATVNRPVTATLGDQYYDTTIKSLFNYSEDGWVKVSQSPAPLISSISPTTSGLQNTEITITGSDFQIGSSVQFIGTNGSIYNSPVITFVTASSVQATTPLLPVAYEPYDVKLINPDNQFSILDNVLDAGSNPTWTTSAGSLGSIVEGSNINFQVIASDPDGASIIYSSSNLPAGVSLNSTTGYITGIAPAVASDTSYTFDITASDGINTTSRTFSYLVINIPFITTNLVVGLDAGLTASYPGSGSTWYDVSGNNNHASLSNVSYGSNNNGYLVFNGQEINQSNAAVSSTQNLNFNNVDGTLSIWMYGDNRMESESTAYHCLVSIGASDSDSQWQMALWRSGLGDGNIYSNMQNAGLFQTKTGNDGYIGGSFAHSLLGAWNNYVLTKSGSTSNFYINGSLYATRTTPAEPLNQANKMNIGGLQTTRAFWGTISQVLVYKNKALTLSEVQSNYNAIKGRYGL